MGESRQVRVRALRGSARRKQHSPRPALAWRGGVSVAYAMTTTVARIKTHEATVKLAAVYVKALMIEKHQVTLAVFRQLRNQDLVDPDSAALAGVPWGTVNYHPSTWGCPAEDNHLHVVWQLGDELRRSMVPRHWPPPMWQRNVERSEHGVRLHLQRHLLARIADGAPVELEWRDDYGWRLTMQASGVPVMSFGAPYLNHRQILMDVHEFADPRQPNSATAKFALRETLHELLGHGVKHPADGSQCGCERRRERLQRELGLSADDELAKANEYAVQYRAGSARAEKAAEAWASQYSALTALDQLFIAV